MSGAVRVTAREQQGWTAISAAKVHLLVHWDEDAPGVALLRAAASTGELDDVLDVLARGGVRQAPDFAAVREASPARVVTRGTAYAVASGPRGEVEMRATGRGPWADEDAPADATSIALHTGRPVPAVPEQPTSPAAALENHAPAPPGWRLPSRLAGNGPAPATPPVGMPPTEAVSVADESAEPEDLPSYDHLFGATQHGRPSPGEQQGVSTGAPAQFLEPHDTDSISEPGIGQAPIEAAGGLVAGPATRSDQTLPPPTDTGRVLPLQPAPAPSIGAAPARPLPAPGGGLIDSVPWRSGGSNVAPPEAPLAGEAPLISQAPPQAPPTAQPHRSAEPRPGGVTTPPPAPTLRPAAPGPPPSAGPVKADPSDAVAEDLDLDVDEDAEATVDRSALLAAAAHRESGPLVLAVLCSAGHPSPPHAGTCRTCAREIPAQQPFQTPRPPLGVLRLASGDVVSLDRGVLLGRSPKVNADLPAAERPHLVRVPSPENDISRNHVEVVLEGWHVLVRDLASTNGTTVALPGQVPVRLRPGDQQLIEPGTTITLADEVSLTFEVAP